MRLSNRALIVTVILILLLVAAACSSNQPQAPIADEQTANTPIPPAAPAPAVEATATPATEAPAAPAPPSASDSITFAVDPTQSEARFVINEELMGNPKTVVGTNNGVSGEVTVNPAAPTGLQIGPIAINAGGFVTDSDRRNGAINRFVLQSGNYPTITFTPTAIEGIPAAVSIGDTLNLQVTGDLTIREISRAETFTVTVQVVSTSELRISGATQILRENYELTIPSVPSVANVTNEVQLQFDFVARAQ
ncbi:MAG: YceI family protein [Chloroflexi bacterium]|nr:MAG: YceI family protein [Chloroflexota bacterium]